MLPRRDGLLYGLLRDEAQYSHRATLAAPPEPADRLVLDRRGLALVVGKEGMNEEEMACASEGETTAMLSSGEEKHGARRPNALYKGAQSVLHRACPRPGGQAPRCRAH